MEQTDIIDKNIDEKLITIDVDKEYGDNKMKLDLSNPVLNTHTSESLKNINKQKRRMKKGSISGLDNSTSKKNNNIQTEALNTDRSIERLQAYLNPK